MKVSTLNEANQTWQTIQELEKRLEWWEKAVDFSPNSTARLCDSLNNYVCSVRFDTEDFLLMKEKQIKQIKANLMELYIIFSEIK